MLKIDLNSLSPELVDLFVAGLEGEQPESFAEEFGAQGKPVNNMVPEFGAQGKPVAS